MSDDHVRLHVEASVVSVSSSLVFLGNSVKKMCTSAPSHITMKTRILGAHIFRLFLSISQVYLNVILSIFLRIT